MSIDVSDICNDSDLAFAFTIQRSTGSFQLGGYVSTPTPIPMWGPVQPSSEKEISMVPEGDRTTGMYTFWSTLPILTTNQNGVADTILWDGNNYRILAIMPWIENGYYLGVGARMTGY